MREHAEITQVGQDRLVESVVDARYQISHKLAEGGFGAIYCAIDLATGRNVALKVLRRELLRDPSVVARFHREAAVLARLSDPHTIRMYDARSEYIVLELLHGETLYEVFQAHGKLPWQRVAAIARGVCSSLREAHALGLIHRDLKPTNIHLEDNDFVKVLDFGIAKQIDSDHTNADLTANGQMIGTFDYMPPEQLLGSACSGKSDVFTLGIVIYEMITGTRPFTDGTGPASRLVDILSDRPAPLVGVPLELSRIVMKALEREPTDRCTVEELDTVLERLLAWQDENEDTLVVPKTFIGVVPTSRRPQLPTVKFVLGPTPSHVALPPPSRFPTGTNPVINKRQQKSPVRYALWAVGLFGIGFATALGIGAIL